jgi:RHS repeat-associated protein
MLRYILSKVNKKNIFKGMFVRLTAGLLVFLFLISPFRFVLADETNSETTPPEQTTQEPSQNNQDNQTPPPADNTTPPSDPVTPPSDSSVTPPTEEQANPPEQNNTTEQTTTDENKFLPSKINLGIDSVNNFGSLHFDYPFTIPAGRNNQTPDLKLTYDSQSAKVADIFGSGWNISIPYIERVNKNGLEKIFTDNSIFNSSLDGEIVATGVGNNYGAKSDSGAFITYHFVNNQSWTATDKQGNVYIFGSTANYRQDNPDDSTHIYRWMLQKVQDTNGNYISYEYFKDQGQIYPSQISYTHKVADAGIYVIDFTHTIRPDQVTTNDLGFAVKTNYFINLLTIKTNGNWTRKYELSYQSGDNSNKSLLHGIIESGRDETTNVVTTLPATTFNYQASTPTWTLNQNWQFPIEFTPTGPFKLIDVNGDGLPDFIHYMPNNQTIMVDLNTGSGWQEAPNYVFPVNPFGQYVQFADVNGDGFVDIIDGANIKVYINNANGTGWTLNQSWEPPINFTNGYETMIDVNGDNLADIIMNCSGCGGNNHYLVFLNNGSGWVQDANWPSFPPETFNQTTRFGDVNGDGLIDIIYSHGQALGQFVSVYINTGSHGWVFDPDWTIDDQNLYYDQPTMTDVNHDGFSDMLIYSVYWPAPQMRAYINNGHGSWDYNSNWVLPQDVFLLNNTDINGDGLTDTIDASWNTRIKMADGVKPDLLSSVTNSQGTTTTISYKGSAQANGGVLLNPSLPVNLQTVSSISTNDGFGNISTTNFKYQDGYYYQGSALDHKFAGFGKITTTDNLTKTISYYHQGNDSKSSQGEYQDHVSKIGKMYRQEVYDLNNNLFSKTINKWDRYDLGNDRNFVKLTQTIESIYDGNTTHKDKAVLYTYDNTNGNLTETEQLGEVLAQDNGVISDSLGTDQYITDISYANSGDIFLPSIETTVDYFNNKVSEIRHYYDNAPLGFLTIGNETKTEQWKDGVNYIETEKFYDEFGNITMQKDPLHNDTAYTYDSYNLYPISVTNQLNQVTGYAYDYSSGKVIQTIDPNGQIFTTHYDGLDRPISEEQPDQNTPNLLVAKTTYEYTDTPNANRIKTSTYLDANNIVDNYVYFDGLGRKIQERNKAENGNQFNVRDFIYTQNDLLLKESLPYSSNSSERTPATTTSALYTTYTYDAMKRVISAQTVVGTTTNSYDDWKTTVTDAKGKVKDLYKDAYDNLVQVNEHNGAAIYSTYYQWNGLKKLTKITDALGNVRNFTYNGLGNVLLAEDLHAVNDTTFGVWSYDYDDASNLISKTAPNTKVTAYTYDGLNRVLTEDAVGTGRVEVTYTYDGCQYGVGRLCLVTNSSITTLMNYNSLGQLTEEEKTIGQETYTTQYDYDRQGNQTLIINPDNSRIAYIYNNAGLVETVQRKEANDPELINVINTIDYNSVGLPTTIFYANGAITNNTYDENELYRLRHKITNAGGQNVQDLTYTYDPVGNITKIVDASNTQTAKTTNYTYDDLYRLLSATISNSSAENVDGPDNQNQVQTFTYDAIGNITYKSDVGTYSYNGNVGKNYANPHAVTNIGDKTYSYDENGNLIKISSTMTPDSKSFSWDYGNRLMSVTINGVTSSYAYDADGQRIKSIDSSGTTLYQTNNYSTGPDGTEKHIFLGDTAIATVKGTGDSAANYDIHTDHLTGSNVVTDSAQQVDELTDYYSFGTIRIDQQNGDLNEKRKFTGHEYDAETGLTYANSRYYDTALGRWLSQDPAFLDITNDKKIEATTQTPYLEYLSNPQAQNSYSYVINNPLKYKDVSGKSLLSVVAEFSSKYLSKIAGPLAVAGYAYQLFGDPTPAGGDLPQGQSYAKGNVTPDNPNGSDKSKISINGGAAVAGVTQQSGVSVGDTFGKLGTVIESQPGKITGIFTRVGGDEHALMRILTRSASIEDIASTVLNPSVVLKQAGNNILYLSEQAGVVLNKVGQIVTVYGAKEFKPNILNILSKVE